MLSNKLYSNRALRLASLGVLAFGLAASPVAASVDIPITLEELLPTDVSGVARTNVPVRFGVPVAESAAVDSTTLVSISGGLPCPQVRPLAKYPNGRWKWMLVETLASLQAGEKKAATLTVGAGGSATGTALASAEAGALVVSTGAATFRIRTSAWNGIDAATVGGVEWIHSGHDLGLVACDTTGVLYKSALDTQGSVGLESNGPLSTTVVARGWLRNASGAALFAYTARLRFALGRPDVELELTVRNAEMARLRPVGFRWVSFRLPLSYYGGGASVPIAFGLNGATKTASLDSTSDQLILYQGHTTWREGHGSASNVKPFLTSDEGVLAMTSSSTLRALGTSADRLDGWLATGTTSYTGTPDLSISVRDLAPLYPTGLRLGPIESGARVLSYDLLSPVNSRTALLWAWGAHHTGTAVLGFGVPAQQSFVQVQFPVFARCGFEYVRQMGAIYGETRLVDWTTQTAWFAQQGHTYTQSLPTYATLNVERNYSFNSTGGPNQYDQNLTYILDYLRAGTTPKMLEALQDASWKADQAVEHSDDFDFGTLANGESDPNVTDPDCWNGHGAGALFDNEHPHWLTLPILYYMTGDERLREAVVDYCEWRRYRAGNHAYGPIYGKGMSSMRLWSRAWRDIALAWEFTRQQRYYDDLVRMTTAIVNSVETPGKNGRNYDRGYIYYGDWAGAGRPIRLFFTNEILGTDAREPYRLLPDGPLREDLRDFITGLSYFTVEARLGAQNIGFTYTYYVAGNNVVGTRGDQVGMLMAHGYEWTGDATFADMARDLAWRPIVYADWERGSEPAALARCWTDLHRNERGAGWIRDLAVTGGNGTYTLSWTAPAGAKQYIVKYASEPMVANLWYDAMAKTYRHDPNQYTPFWAGKNVSDEPTPGAVGTSESMTLTGLSASAARYFAVEYLTDSPVAPAVGDVSNLTSSYDEGAVKLSWSPATGASGARVVRNDSTYAGFAAFPENGTLVYDGTAASATDQGSMQRGRKYYYTVFAKDGVGRYSLGARIAVTYDPPDVGPSVSNASASPTSGEVSLAVQFSASASDPDGNLATTSWSFGDGSASTPGTSATHTYTQAGSYTATFTATDSTQLSRSRTVAIQVSAAAPPQVTLTASRTSGRTPAAISFVAAVTDQSALSDTLWVFAPGDTTRATRASRTYTSGGRKVARFRAVDAHGLAKTDSVVVTLAPPDTTAPAIVSQAPAAGATGVARTPSLVVSLADSATGIDTSSLQLSVNGTQVSATTSGTPQSLTLSYAPSSPFAIGATVSVRLRAADRASTPNKLDSTWTFTTEADSVPPAIVSRSPVAGAVGAARGASIAVALADPMTGMDVSSLRFFVNGTQVSTRFEGGPAACTLTYTPPAPYSFGAQITVRVVAADRASTPNVRDASWSYTVRTDTEAPLLTLRSPDAGATAVARSAGIQAGLADSLTGLDLGSIVLYVDGALVTSQVSGNAAAATVSYTPPAGFAAQKTVTLRVRASDRATPGNVLDTSWSFQTEIAPRLVNFQPSGFTTPAGYVPDLGKVYDPKLGYGWLTKTAVENSKATTDPRLNSDAYVTSPASATWQLALPAGTYAVTLVVGSPTGSAVNRVELEGAVVVNNVAAATGKYYTVTDWPVSVTDGFLTLRMGGIAGLAKKTKLCYVEVRNASGARLAPRTAGAGGTDEPPAPVAQALGMPLSGEAPLEVSFRGGTTSKDADADLRYTWDFGDGTSAGGRTAHHLYSSAGRFAAVLTVTEASGGKAADSVLIDVAAPEPSSTSEGKGTHAGFAGARTRVNFQPADFEVPAGYRADSGAPFDIERGYGWDAPVSADRAHTILDGVHNSYVEVDNRQTATFSMVMPNGKYRVSIVAGSPKGTALNRVEVEGQRVVADVETHAGGFVEETRIEVEVHDGALNVVIGGNGKRGKTKLCSLEVEPITEPAADPKGGTHAGSGAAAAADTANAGATHEGPAKRITEPAIRIESQGAGTPLPIVELVSPVSAPLHVRLYDARGRLVRTLWHGQAPAGSLRLQWDRHEDSGRTAAAGIYFVRADLGPRILTAKVPLLH